jgi:hypothetical protein
MGIPSLTWTLPTHRGSRTEVGARERDVVRALVRCRAAGRTSVLFVEPGPAEAGLVTRVRAAGACVTVLCAEGRRLEALENGADFVMDPRRTDPTWYRGAWSVIVDPGRRFGFRRARPSLARDGAYVTASPSAGDRLRALASRVSRGPRLAAAR